MTDRLKLIETVEDLHYYLIQGMKIEHATFPPYLTALYSLKPGSNLEAFHIIRAIAVEEMLHLTLAANVFNAVGGDMKGVLTADDFVPTYPTPLPTGAVDFEVSVGKFSPEMVQTFLNIERSKEVEEDAPLVKPRHGVLSWLPVRNGDPHDWYYSIGLFYTEVIRGMQELEREYQRQGKTIFTQDPEQIKKQITPEYYYDGAGDIVPVTDIRSAVRALRIIQEQGEGSRHGTIYDAERELCHYYRFQQLDLGQYYVIDKDDPLQSDQPDHPSGDSFTVDWDGVYPVLENAQITDYPEGSEVYAAGEDFHKAYKRFLGDIEKAFNGHPHLLLHAIGGMFKLRDLAERLIRNPIPGREDGAHAAPIYSIPK